MIETRARSAAGMRSFDLIKLCREFDRKSQSADNHHLSSAVAKVVGATFYLSTSRVASAPIKCLRGWRMSSEGLRLREPEWDSTRDLCDGLYQGRHKPRARGFTNSRINPYALFDPGACKGLCRAAQELLATMQWGQD